MQQSLHILSKELKDYFISPIAYIVISIFLVVTGWFFFSTFFLYNQAELRNFFTLLPITFAFVIPAVTMRLFSEEFNVGSYEILLTLPVSFKDIILGKFLAAVLFMAAALLPTLSYPICVSTLGELDWGPVMGGYMGAILLAAAYAAIGLFASSLTRNQIVAFIVGTVICFSDSNGLIKARFNYLWAHKDFIFYGPPKETFETVLSKQLYESRRFHFDESNLESKGFIFEVNLENVYMVPINKINN